MSIDDFVFLTKPFQHQREEWEISRSMEARAIFWDQGTGKSKVSIDTAQWLYRLGEIDGVVVLAPNGVHRNWVTDELPAHMPPDVRLTSHFYQSPKSSTKWHKKACDEVLAAEGLAVLTMSYDGVMTKAGHALVKKFLLKRNVLIILDESHKIKAPGTKRTMRVLSLRDYALYRRILSGTPVANIPFDVYSQIKFVDGLVWKPYGVNTFAAFKAFFGKFTQGFNSKTERFYDVLVGFRNLHILNEIVSKVGSRVTKDEVLDLPPKLFSKRYVDLTPQQWRLYKDLRDEFMAFLDSGDLVTAPLAIVRMLRLQQIICGYLPTDDGEMVRLDGGNPRMAVLKEIAEDLHPERRAIIWARFREDIDQIMAMLAELNKKTDNHRAVRYDGAVDDDQRAKAKDLFQKTPIAEGGARFFVANAQAAGTGLTLHAATTVVYYSNTFNLTDRLQSEDRAHRIGQEHPVDYIDLVAADTIDEHIVKALRKKFDIAREVTGDQVKEWI